ncbi:hypothetical protein [Streptomyces sp. NBC_00882]|uniref:hypothetical protein n=1 Tax=Streptomyces sp. NBC_00882 TaxID=2975856 RepID=UPI0038672304
MDRQVRTLGCAGAGSGFPRHAAAATRPFRIGARAVVTGIGGRGLVGGRGDRVVGIVVDPVGARRWRAVRLRLDGGLWAPVPGLVRQKVQDIDGDDGRRDEGDRAGQGRFEGEGQDHGGHAVLLAECQGDAVEGLQVPGDDPADDHLRDEGGHAQHDARAWLDAVDQQHAQAQQRRIVGGAHDPVEGREQGGRAIEEADDRHAEHPPVRGGRGEDAAEHDEGGSGAPPGGRPAVPIPQKVPSERGHDGQARVPHRGEGVRVWWHRQF